MKRHLTITSESSRIQFEVLSYNHGISMPVEADENESTDSVTVIRPSKQGAAYQDLCISKYHDSASPLLNLLCCKGQLLKTVELEIPYSQNGHSEYNAREDGVGGNISKIILTDCLITSISIGGGGDTPIETITMIFSKIKWINIDENKIEVASEWKTIRDIHE